MYAQQYAKKHSSNSSTNKMAQKTLNDSFSIQNMDKYSNKSKYNQNEVAQIYNLKSTKQSKNLNIKLGDNPFFDDKASQIKVFQASTKSSLDKKPHSQQQKNNPNLQKRLFSNVDTELNGSFTRMNTSTLIESERLTQCSPKSTSKINETIQIRLHKQIDQKFLNFIKEYGLIVKNDKSQMLQNPSSFTASTERSRLPSNEYRQGYYHCTSNTPPPQKNFRTKLFNHVN